MIFFSISSSSTTLFSKPKWYASLAEIGSPKINISLAFFLEEMALINYTAGVEQNRPHLIPGVEKDDFSEAIKRSHAKASWNPAAAAIPFTAHRVGTDEFLIFSISSAQESKIYLGFWELANSLRSWPEQKTGPSPWRTRIYYD